MADNERAEASADPTTLGAKQLLAYIDETNPDNPDLARLDADTIAANIDPSQLGKTDFSRLLYALDRLSAAGSGLDVSQVKPETFAKLIGRASKAQLADVLGKEQPRALILDEIFRRMSTHLRADRAAETKALVHWRFSGGSGEGGYDRYETNIDNGVCTANKAQNRHQSEKQPRVSITLSPADFLQLIIGKASAPLLFVTGKLKVKGDLAFAAGMMSLFDLPKADAES